MTDSPSQSPPLVKPAGLTPAKATHVEIIKNKRTGYVDEIIMHIGEPAPHERNGGEIFEIDHNNKPPIKFL